MSRRFAQVAVVLLLTFFGLVSIASGANASSNALATNAASLPQGAPLAAAAAPAVQAAPVGGFVTDKICIPKTFKGWNTVVMGPRPCYNVPDKPWKPKSYCAATSSGVPDCSNKTFNYPKTIPDDGANWQDYPSLSTYTTDKPPPSCPQGYVQGSDRRTDFWMCVPNQTSCDNGEVPTLLDPAFGRYICNKKGHNVACSPGAPPAASKKGCDKVDLIDAAKAAGKGIANATKCVFSPIDCFLRDLSKKWVETFHDGYLKWASVWVTEENVAPGNTARFVRFVLFPIAGAVAVAGVIWQGIAMIISRRSEPVIDLVRGLFVLTLWLAVGIAGPAIALDAADDMSTWIINAGQSYEKTPGQECRVDGSIEWDQIKKCKAEGKITSKLSAEEVQEKSRAILGERTEGSLYLLVLAPVMAISVWVLQALLQLRNGIVIILAGATVLAAAGSFTNATRGWLPKVMSWMLALICYKPVAAMVFASSVWMSEHGESVEETNIGLFMMFVSVAALPVMYKMFSWATGQVSGGGGAAAGGVASSFALYRVGPK